MGACSALGQLTADSMFMNAVLFLNQNSFAHPCSDSDSDELMLLMWPVSTKTSRLGVLLVSQLNAGLAELRRWGDSLYLAGAK